jgi:hypothetical protein
VRLEAFFRFPTRFISPCSTTLQYLNNALAAFTRRCNRKIHHAWNIGNLTTYIVAVACLGALGYLLCMLAFSLSSDLGRDILIDIATDAYLDHWTTTNSLPEWVFGTAGLRLVLLAQANLQGYNCPRVREERWACRSSSEGTVLEYGDAFDRPLPIFLTCIDVHGVSSHQCSSLL